MVFAEINPRLLALNERKEWINIFVRFNMREPRSLYSFVAWFLNKRRKEEKATKSKE